jgi:hypothetical protein
MLHEVLLALAGQPGSMFVYNKHPNTVSTGFKVSGEAQMGVGERQELNSIIDLGYRYRLVKDLLEKLTKTSRSLYVRALCNAVKRITDEYIVEISKVEREILRLSSFRVTTLAHLKSHFALYKTMFLELYDLLVEVETLNLRGGELLNRVYERSHTGIPCLKSHVQHILLCVHGVFYRQLVSWITNGIIHDRGEDFIIEERNSGHLLAPETATGRLQKRTYGSKPRDGMSAARDELMWETQFRLRLDMVPTSYLPYRVADKVLFIGKAIKLLKEHDRAEKMAHKNRTGQEGTAGGALMGDAAQESKKVMHEFITAMDSLRQSQEFKIFALESELEKVHKYVTYRLYDMLLNKSNLKRHLLAMKEYFLLSKGEFFQCFLDEGREMFKRSPTTFATQDMNLGPLKRAGAKLGIDNDIAFKCVSFNLYSPSFTITNFDESSNIVLSENFASFKEGVLILACIDGNENSGRQEAGRATTMGVGQEDREVVESSAMYREPKVVEHGFATNISLAFNRKMKGEFTFALHNDQSATVSNSHHSTRTLSNALLCSVRCDAAEVHLRIGARPFVTVDSNENDTFDVLGEAKIPLPGTNARGASEFVKCALRFVYEYKTSEMAMRFMAYFKQEGGDGAARASGKGRPGFLNKGARDGTSPVIEFGLNIGSKVSLISGSDGGKAWVVLGSSKGVTIRDIDEDLGEGDSAQDIDSRAFQVRTWSFESVLQRQTSFDSWSKLQLVYHVPWPLHIIFTQATLVQYNEMFRFLFTIKRVSLSLSECWATLMETGKTRHKTQSRSFLHLCRLRTRMGFLMDALEYFLYVDVVESEWHGLQNEINDSKSFDGLYKAHIKFITSIKRRCLLDARTIRKTLDCVLQLCVKLCGTVAENNEDVMSIHPLEVERIDAEYTRHSNYLYLVLSGISENLKTRLDYNGQFSASTSAMAGGRGLRSSGMYA